MPVKLFASPLRLPFSLSLSLFCSLRSFRQSKREHAPSSDPASSKVLPLSLSLNRAAAAAFSGGGVMLSPRCGRCMQRCKKTLQRCWPSSALCLGLGGRSCAALGVCCSAVCMGMFYSCSLVLLYLTAFPPTPKPLTHTQGSYLNKGG